jgi:Ala-tRNA(Pro) deacylase
MFILHEIPFSLQKYLDSNDVPYELIPHPRDYCAQETAADTHTPGRFFAKCVLVWIDNYYAMVVVPADHIIDSTLLRDAVQARNTGLVREEEMNRLFPDCEIGAEPPFGHLYDLPVFVDSRLAVQPTITFNAGTHEMAVRMSFDDFERLTAPTIVECAVKVPQ